MRKTHQSNSFTSIRIKISAEGDLLNDISGTYTRACDVTPDIGSRSHDCAVHLGDFST